MTGQNTPEQTTTPDPATFDFESWLATGKTGRARETVTIYNDLDAVQEATELQRELAKLTDQPDTDTEDLAVGEKSKLTELQDRWEQAKARMDAAKATVEVTALSDAEIERIQADFQREHGGKVDPLKSHAGTCAFLAAGGTINGRRLTAEQWEQLSEKIAGGQWLQIKQAHIVAQQSTPRVDSPFSRAGSRLSPAVRAG